MKADFFYEMGNYNQAGITYRLGFILFPDPLLIDDYKDKSRDLLIKSLDLFLVENFKDAYSTFLKAVDFDPANENTKVVRGRSLKELKRFIWLQSKKMTSKPYKMRIDAAVPEEAMNEKVMHDDIDLLQTNYISKRIPGYLHQLEAEVADPDDYDLTYNQYNLMDFENDIE
jgi:tetratricopeptide (TPR) repeat protein